MGFADYITTDEPSREELVGIKESPPLSFRAVASSSNSCVSGMGFANCITTDEHINVIARGKAMRVNFCFMLPNSCVEIRTYTDVKSRLVLV
jgi:hypothetical protein